MNVNSPKPACFVCSKRRTRHVRFTTRSAASMTSWPNTAKGRSARSALTSLLWHRENASLRSATEPATAWCKWQKQLGRKARYLALTFPKECGHGHESEWRKDI